MPMARFGASGERRLQVLVGAWLGQTLEGLQQCRPLRREQSRAKKEIETSIEYNMSVTLLLLSLARNHSSPRRSDAVYLRVSLHAVGEPVGEPSGEPVEDGRHSQSQGRNCARCGSSKRTQGTSHPTLADFGLDLALASSPSIRSREAQP